MAWIWPRREFEVADDITHVLFRGGDLDGHHRLEKHRLRLAAAAFITIEPAILKAMLGRVDLG